MPFDEVVESSDPVLTPTPIESLGGTTAPDIITWPWPKLVPTAYHTFSFMEGINNALFLYELTLEDGGVWAGVQVGIVGNIYDVSYADVIDFGYYYIVLVVSSTGTRNFARLLGESLVEIFSPCFAVGCNNNGQFLGGNISHNNYDLGSDGIMWSDIGNFSFDPSKDQTSGFRTLVCGKIPGKRAIIKRILPYGGGVNVYTDFGVVLISDAIVGNTFTYSLVELEGFGVASPNEVAGNHYFHGFVNMNNEFVRFQRTKGNTPEILGFKRQIEELRSTGTVLLLSFLEDRNTFLLSNGVSTLVVNDYGGGMIHQAVSGIVKGWDKVLYGTFRDFGDVEGRIILDGNSFDSRGTKTLEWVIADINHNPETLVHSAASWRNSASNEWKNFVYKNGTPSGEFFLGLSAVEYRVKLRFNNYVGSEIYGLKLAMKYPDARTRRGIAAISGVNTREGATNGSS